MTGADLTVRSPDRAMMRDGDNYSYLDGERLLVLEPGKPARQVSREGREEGPAGTDPDATPKQDEGPG